MRIILSIFGLIVYTFISLASPLVQKAPWKVTVVPMSAVGFSPEDSLALLQQVRNQLATSKLVELMPEEEMMRLLRDAQFQDIRECTYSHCLADLGKIVGVDRVLQTIFVRRGKLYSFRLRVINAKDAEILFDETVEHSGEYQPFFTSVVPDLVTKATEPTIESRSSWKWYYIGAAVLGFGAMVYYLNKMLGHSGPPAENPAPPVQD